MRHAQRLQRIDFAGRDGRGIEPAVEIAKQKDESANDGRFGIGAEMTVAGAELADQPHDGHAAVDAVRVDAVGGWQGRDAFRAIDDERESLLGVVEHGDVFDELLEFARQRHGESVVAVGAAARARKCAGMETVGGGCRSTRQTRVRLQAGAKCADHLQQAVRTMAENVLIPLPDFELPTDYPWRVGFVALVNDQLRKLRATGHFLPPRFFGYYFQRQVPKGVGGSWTVSLDAKRPVSVLPRLLERITHGAYTITSPGDDEMPEFLLVHDRRDGACWLWSFADGLRFVEAVEPTQGDEDWWNDADQRKLLGP